MMMLIWHVMIMNFDQLSLLSGTAVNEMLLAPSQSLKQDTRFTNRIASINTDQAINIININIKFNTYTDQEWYNI